MIKLTVEICPPVGSSQLLGVITITNDATGTVGFGNYLVWCQNHPDVVVRLENYDRNRGWFSLVLAAMTKLETAVKDAMKS